MVLCTSTSRQLARHLASRFLAACVPAALLASAAYAQTAAPPASAFESYKPYTDEPVGNWKAANDTTARIGGWREYARQAQGAQSKPDNMTEPVPKAVQAKPDPVKKAKP